MVERRSIIVLLPSEAIAMASNPHEGVDHLLGDGDDARIGLIGGLQLDQPANFLVDADLARIEEPVVEILRDDVLSLMDPLGGAVGRALGRYDLVEELADRAPEGRRSRADAIRRRE